MTFYSSPSSIKSQPWGSVDTNVLRWTHTCLQKMMPLPVLSLVTSSICRSDLMEVYGVKRVGALQCFALQHPLHCITSTRTSAYFVFNKHHPFCVGCHINACGGQMHFSAAITLKFISYDLKMTWLSQTAEVCEQHLVQPLTHSKLNDRYVIHQLLSRLDSETPISSFIHEEMTNGSMGTNTRRWLLSK